MERISKTILVLLAGMFLQACAPQSDDMPQETWWRVTPVDISEPQENLSSGGVEVFSCLKNANDYFSSIDPACEGETLIGHLRYLHARHSSQTPNAVYRCGNDEGSRHFDTTDLNDCLKAGFKVDVVLGYSP